MFEILERRISYRNIGWTKDRLWLLIVDENPCISYKEGKKKANMVHKELNKMNFNSHYNTKKYFDAFDYDVKFIILLDNYRAKTPFDGGTLFIDYSEYCGNTDYEIEYEVNHYEKGMIAWDELLSNFKIEIKPLKRKSERALTCLI